MSFAGWADLKPRVRRPERGEFGLAYGTRVKWTAWVNETPLLGAML